MATIMDEYDDGEASLEYKLSSVTARRKVNSFKISKLHFQGAIFAIMSSEKITKLATYFRRPSRVDKTAISTYRRDTVARNIPKDTAAID